MKEISKEISKETVQTLEGIRKEIIASKCLITTTEAGRTWNDASDRAVHIIDMYRRGEGLFQQ
jgi:hypothetical protein